MIGRWLWRYRMARAYRLGYEAGVMGLDIWSCPYAPLPTDLRYEWIRGLMDGASAAREF